MMQGSIQWNLSWETTAMRDHLSWKTTYFWHGRFYISIQLNLSPKTISLERPHFYVRRGGLSRQVLLYCIREMIIPYVHYIIVFAVLVHHFIMTKPQSVHLYKSVRIFVFEAFEPWFILEGLTINRNVISLPWSTSTATDTMGKGNQCIIIYSCQTSGNHMYSK